MMSNQLMQTLINPAVRCKVPLLDGAVASTGLSEPEKGSEYLGTQMLQYNGAYLTYDPRGKDKVQFTPPGNNSKTSLVDGINPVSHLSGTERENRLIYRQDNSSTEERHSRSSSLHPAPVKRGFTLYNKSPGISCPPAANSEAMTQQRKRGDNSSPSSKNSVYIAIPKPVYGHNPCCDNPRCVIGQRYSMEHGPQRIPKSVYEHDWMQADARYSERTPIQRNAQEALMQQIGLQFEPSAEQLKRIHVESYCPGRARTLPTLIEPNYPSYPCTLTPTLFGSLSEQSSQTPTRGYPSLYPSHYTYEHMTSEFYQEHSPMSKYGHQIQRPMFYYTQADVEVESSTPCKDIDSRQRQDVPVTLKHTISNPREHYMVPQSIHGEIPLPLANTEALHNHSLKQAFGYPCFTYPRIHVNASQLRPPPERQQTSPVLRSNCKNVSPSSQCTGHPITPTTDRHKAKPNSILHIEHAPHTNLPFLCVEHISPTRCTSRPGLSPSSIQMNRFFPPLGSLHIDQPVLPPTALNMDRFLDYSSFETQVRSPKRPNGLPASPAARRAPSPRWGSDPIDTTLHANSNVRKLLTSPIVAPAKQHIGPMPSSNSTVLKGSLKRSLSHSSSAVKINEKDREVEPNKKRLKVEVEDAQEASRPKSPPMPVIASVFSLAPYKKDLQTSGVLFAGRVPQGPVQSSENCEVKTRPEVKEKRQYRDEQEPVVCRVSKEICMSTTMEKPEVEIFERKIKVEKKDSSMKIFVKEVVVSSISSSEGKCDEQEPIVCPVSKEICMSTTVEKSQVETFERKIKVEKEDASYTDSSEEIPKCQKECSKAEVKREPEETGSSNSEYMLVIKKCEPEEPETIPSVAHKNETSDEAKPGEMTEQMRSSPRGDSSTPHQQAFAIQPKSIVLADHRLNYENLTPHCLKLYNYKLSLHHTTHSAPPPEEPHVQPTPECTPKLDVQMPVRKHFLELHRSLQQLISKSVSASSEQELRAWLSQLELTAPASSSTKVQKVSCLLGLKAREVWLNEEIKSALHTLLERLREYTTQERCPFPHVMRTRAVFLPMMVVKEMLFPMVQGGLIDQVLQEHRVELRPTTLSEEKILIQLFKRACSSRLMRLMSLKHLPDIYADVVNLSYYICVCRHLGLDMDDVTPRVKDERCEETISSTPAFCDATTSPASREMHAPRHAKDREEKSDLNRNRRKRRVKSSSRRMFLDNSLSDEEQAEDAASVGVLNAFSNKDWHDHQSEGTKSSLCTAENSWTRPLTLDELSPSPCDPKMEEPSSLWPESQSSGAPKPAVKSSSCSGMILKLRKMFRERIDRKKTRYQEISHSRKFVDASLSQTKDVEGKVCSEADGPKRTPIAPHRWQRTGSFSHTLRPLRSSKGKHKSLTKIKYCPYLAACHSADHKRRWVLRSAVQRAERALRFYSPDLVGKRIWHLYENDDKSEAWYSGEVLRVHEAHTNPLKTIYEVRYDSEPEWKYYVELLMDYKKGWLKIED